MKLTKIITVLLYFALISVCISPAIFNISIGALLLLIVLSKPKLNKEIILFNIYFFLVLIGYFFFNLYSVDKKFLLFSMNSIPLSFVALHNSNLLPDKDRIMNAFLIGMILSMLIAFGTSLYDAFIHKDIMLLTYHNLSSHVYMHPSYYSIFIIVALLIVNKRWTFIKNIYLIILFNIICAVFILLLESRVGLFLFLASYIFQIAVYDTKTVYKVIFLFIIGLTVFITIKTNDRFKELSIWGYEANRVSRIQQSSSTLRRWVWDQEIKQIKENKYIGYGYQSQSNLFYWHYMANNLEDIEDVENYKIYKPFFNHNTHNQYLDIIFEYGIFGLILCALPIFFFVINSLKTQRHISFYLLFCILSLCFFENILERQMGYNLFCFLFPIAYQLKI